MRHSCYVPNCGGSYDPANKVGVFSFPRDEDCKADWIGAIPKKDNKYTLSPRVSMLFLLYYIFNLIELLMVTKLIITCLRGVKPVSYTHLDVYKRQIF